MDRRLLHRRVRIVWATAGILGTIALVWTFQAHGVPRGTLANSSTVTVRELPDRIAFVPTTDTAGAGLVFFPGGMVQPRAYAPLARAVAEAGYPAVIVRLPFLGRHAPTDGYRSEAIERARGIMTDGDVLEDGEEPGSGRAGPPDGERRRWVVAGHSFGGALAAEFARAHPERTSGLVLIGTTHPRDFDLSGAEFPVVKILGSRDGVAPQSRSRENDRLLPSSTRILVIDGGNHAQFGYYGPQLMDHRATISRQEQERRTVDVIVRMLRDIRHRGTVGG